MDRQERKKTEDEKKRIAKYNRELRAKIRKEPEVKCTFVNLESPGICLDFTYEGESFHFDDGVQYMMRIGVIEHLNSLKIPIKRYKRDPASGQLMPETEIAAFKNRFSVTPVDMAKYVEGLKAGNETDNED